MEIGNRKLIERKRDLKKLLKALLDNREAIANACRQDLNKPSAESDLSEVYPVKVEIKHTLANLDQWAARSYVSTPLSMIGTRSWVRPEPKGVVLIISPWNFPFNLTFCPLVSALAAGNSVILKPSESTPNCSALMAKIIADTFDPDHVCVVEGGPEVSSHLVSLPFNHIFFTGGPQIGKKVLKAAAEHLTPVTLELGGKSPAIVDRTANLEDAAQRIVWARFYNSGQVCIAPDYVLVDDEVADRFVKLVAKQVARFYGDPINRQALSSLVHAGHFTKITAFIADAKKKGANVICGGEADEKTRFVPPTVLHDVSADMDVMTEEIFGPILPIINWRTVDEALSIVNQLERPLAYYIFSHSRANTRRFTNESRAGSSAINETFIQFIHPELPFGGINYSGMGKAHGKYGFDTFSNARSFVKQTFRWNAPLFAHPPYGAFTRKLADVLLRWF